MEVRRPRERWDWLSGAAPWGPPASRRDGRPCGPPVGLQASSREAAFYTDTMLSWLGRASTPMDSDPPALPPATDRAGVCGLEAAHAAAHHDGQKNYGRVEQVEVSGIHVHLNRDHRRDT